MDGILVNTGKTSIFGRYFGIPPTIYVGLCSNNPSWTYATVFSDLTECAWSGYLRTLASGWNNIGFDSSQNLIYQATPILLQNNSGSTQTIDGFFYYDSGYSTLIGGNRFNSPPLSLLNGQYIVLLPAMQIQSQF